MPNFIVTVNNFFRLRFGKEVLHTATIIISKSDHPVATVVVF